MLKESISGSSISFGRRAFFCFFCRFHQSLCQKPSLLLFSRTVTNPCWSRKSSHLPTLHGSLILVMCSCFQRHVSLSYSGNFVCNLIDSGFAPLPNGILLRLYQQVQGVYRWHRKANVLRSNSYSPHKAA